MPAPPCGNYGDIDLSGDVTQMDAFRVQRHVAGLDTLTPDQFLRADVDGDGVVTQADADWISNYANRNATTFPVCGATETRTVSLTEGPHDIQISLDGYNTLQATINVSATGVTCVSVVGGACGGTGLPRVSTSAWTVTTYLKTATTVDDVCSWLTGLGGWRNLQWASHVLEAYYVYIGAAGHSVGFSPVTWNDVLGLYYYYINDPTAGNGKIGCGT